MTVTNEAGINTALTNREAEIIVANNITVTAYKTIDYAVHIFSESGATLFWQPSSATNLNMLVVTAAGNLTMSDITLDAGGRDARFVQLNGGTFTMNDGVIMQNIVSTQGNSAVGVGSNMNDNGGNFIMNGGLITNVNSANAALFCSGGTVTMDNDATVEGNLANALVIMCTSTAARTRSTLYMKGQSRISNNTSVQSGAGILLYESDAFIGVDEGDAPVITGNISPYHCGGILAIQTANLTIGQGTEISGNAATDTTGALYVQGSTLRIGGNAVIKDNKSGTISGGISIVSDSEAVFEGNAEISGNIPGDGAPDSAAGGVLIQSGSTLEIKGNVSIHGNTAGNGGGIYITVPSATGTPPVLTIGTEGSSPSIYENTATVNGGGIFIADRCDVTIMGHTKIHDNKAVEGKGVYNAGICRIGESMQILDGLFFDNYTDGAFFLSGAESPEEIKQDEEHILIETGFMKRAAKNASSAGKAAQVAFSAKKHVKTEAAASVSARINQAQEPAQCEYAPIIEEILTTEALIYVEPSGHVSRPNAPLELAIKGEARVPLTETDRAAWRIPTGFAPEYSVLLYTPLEEVIIGGTAFNIEYRNLLGAEHANPPSYTVEDLPITLAAPTERPGYAFVGWQDAAGNIVTGIASGTTGNISLTAVWKELYLNFDGNGKCVRDVPKKVRANNGKATIPSPAPCRPGYIFLGWNEPSSGSGKVYFPGDTVHVSGKDVTLYAQWQPADGCCCKPYKHDKHPSELDQFPTH